MHQMTTQICWRPMAPILVLLSSFLLLWPLEGIRAEMRMSPELDGMRKELNELRSRVQELMASQNNIEVDEGNAEEMFNNKRAMLPYSGGIYGKRAAAMLPYSGGIYGKRSTNNNGGDHLVAAEPSFILSRPNRAVPFNGGIFGR